MSRQAAAGEIGELKNSLAFGLRLTLFVTIPATVGLMVCATPIFSLLFMGGEFDFITAAKAAQALFYYALGLSLVALVRVLVPAFYALKDTRTPVITAFVAFLLNLCFSLMLMGPLLHAGLALASSLSALCNMALLLYLLRKKIGPFGGRGIFLAGAKAALASVPMALFVAWAMRLTDWTLGGHKTVKALTLLGGIGAGAVIFLIVAHLVRCEETHDAVDLFRRKVLKK
jgi:putative peptidoglycan lipid II flippase